LAKGQERKKKIEEVMSLGQFPVNVHSGSWCLILQHASMHNEEQEAQLLL